MFFSFDGLDGVGKTTQLELFCDWLRASGHEVVSCYDPGSTPLGETIRKILLERGSLSIDLRSEMLLFMAARAQLVAEVIRPNLQAGRVIVSDRFLLANVVYQGYAGGLDIEEIWQIGRVATAGIQPDLTFVLDMPPQSAFGRIDRPLDRMEIQTAPLQDRLRHGYVTEAARRPKEIALVDASRSIEAVQADIRGHAGRVLAG
jgi:dTMP kinase